MNNNIGLRLFEMIMLSTILIASLLLFALVLLIFINETVSR